MGWPNFSPVLIASIGLIMVTGRVGAQTFTTLHYFKADSGYPSYTNSDGVQPIVSVISSNKLYGTAGQGGNSGKGTIFKVNTDGSGFTNLHNFTALSAPYYTNDGAFPNALILSSNTLYGTAHEGGGSGRGTIFAINTDGSGFTNLYTFSDDSDGVFPSGALILSGNTFYGAAYSGGSSGNGAVFKVNIDGTGFTNLHSFAASYYNPIVQDYTNSEGALLAGLILSGNTLYGTAYSGGSSSHGTLFKLNTDGLGFTNLHNFTATDINILGTYTNSDGANPSGGLILSGNTLYGTAMNGGSSGCGTVFKVNTDSTDFATLYSFTALGPAYWTNSDGATPYAGLVLFGNTLYGTAAYGGSLGRGTVFAVNTDGSDFVTLYRFAGSNGAVPIASLILLGNTLYGTASQGGSTNGNGTVFGLSFRPQQTIILSAAKTILTWPTNYAGFDYTGYTLQSATNLVSPSWTTNLPTPVVVDGLNTITNPISGSQQFFRLSR